MLSFCRSGLLALTLVSGSMADVQALTQRIAHDAWFSDVSIERLQDKSVLTEYFGERVSEEHKDVVFRVGFIPRFGCAPLITVNFGNEAIAESASDSSSAVGTDKNGKLNPANFPSDLARLGVWIDGAVLSFPTLVDKNANNISVYLNADLQRRITARLRVEIGSKMRVELRTGQRVHFSLAGSRDALSIANQNCRQHDPSTQG